jgi:hypothetical protein
MEKIDFLNKEEFINFIKLQTKTLKAYKPEDALVGTINILMFEGLKKIVTPHLVDTANSNSNFVSFGTKVLKLDEWEVFGDFNKENEFAIIIRTSSGMTAIYPLFRVKKGFFEDFEDLRPCVDEFAKKFFLLIRSMLYNSYSEDLLATEEEFLAHAGEVKLEDLK